MTSLLPDVMLFDLDGTLVDSVPDIAVAVDGMLVEMGRSPAGEAVARTWVGNGLVSLVHRALTGDIDGTAAKEDHDRGVRAFRSHYARCCTDMTRAFDGALDLLGWLRAKDVSTAVTTNKPADFAHRIVEATGMAQHVQVLCGAGENCPLKPDPAMLHTAVERLGGGEAWLVGDSRTDRDAARAAGMRFLAVRLGYNHGYDIAADIEPPEAVFDSLVELHAWLKGAVA